MKKLFILSAIILCASCKKEQDFITKNISIVQDKDFTTTEEIKIEKSNLDTLFRVPLDLQIQGKYLIANEARKDSTLFYLFELPSLNLIGEIGTPGKGKGQILNAWQTGINNGKAYALGLTLQKMLEYDIDSIKTLGRKAVPKEYFLKERVNSVYELEFLNNETFVGLSNRSKDSRMFFNTYKNGIQTTKTTPYPIRFEQNYPSEAMTQIFDANATFDANKTKIFVANTNIRLIEIYDIDGNILKFIKFGDFKLPNFDIETSDGFPMYIDTGNNERTFLDIAASDKYLCAIFSGKVDQWESYSSKYMYVFDLDGNPIKKVILNTEIALIHYSTIDDKFYAISVDENGDSDLVKFTI